MNREKIRSIREKLESQLEIYEMKYQLHHRNEQVLKRIYYTAGALTVVLGIVLTFMTGTESIRDSENAFTTVIFAITLLNALVSGIVAFSALETKASRHHDNKINYSGLIKDVSTFIATAEDNPDRWHEQLLMVNERAKMCVEQEQGNTFCFQIQ